MLRALEFLRFQQLGISPFEIMERVFLKIQFFHEYGARVRAGASY
jgi:hypothetical protein